MKRSAHSMLLLVIAACNTSEPPVPSSQQAVALIGKTYISPGAGADTLNFTRNPYEGDPAAVTQGKQFYTWYNCHSCHGTLGGGGMGPPLLDAQWIYGGDPVSIFESILEGRPNGMPTWRGRIPDDQAWKIVAYVQSLQKNPAAISAPSRVQNP